MWACMEEDHMVGCASPSISVLTFALSLGWDDEKETLFLQRECLVNAEFHFFVSVILFSFIFGQ